MQNPSSSDPANSNLLQTNKDALVQGVKHLAEANEQLTVIEQRLRLALESGRLGSWDLDIVTHHYLEISDIWKQSFGRPDVGDITQDEFLMFLHPDDRERVHEAAASAVQERRDYAADYRAIWPDGSVHWMSAHGKLLYDTDGNPVRMIGVTQIIDERKQIEADRERELEKARELADRDPLTSLLNHRSFYRCLDEEIVRVTAHGLSLAAVMLDMDGFKFFNDAYGHTVGDQVLQQVAAYLQALCRPGDTLARFGGDEFALLLPVGSDASPAEIEARLRARLGSLAFCPDGQAVAIPLTVSLGAAVFPGETRDRANLIHLADERLLRSKSGGASDTQADQVRRALAHVDGFSMLDALVTAVDNKDRYTSRHSEDVMEYSQLIARELGIDEKTQSTVAVAALLHDVGKIGVPDAILRKPARLTDKEFTAVKHHPQMGAIMVSSVAGLEETLDAVRYHHERWDGGGYPAGLHGEETPLIARIMAVADAYSAMTTDRPYRQGMSRAQALSILEEGSGVQWDPQCVQAFHAALP
jgi:diguanylate cyclase (GGDEF)-like protein